MARIINQNNEVIAKKDANNKVIEKKPISKTSLIVGIVLFAVALVISIVLIVYFTGNKKKDNEDVPTLLEQYVSNYQNKVKKDYQITILTSFTSQITEYTDECYVLIYDTNWMEDNQVDSNAYKYYLNIDEWFVGSGTTVSGSKKSSVFDALLNSGSGIRFFIVDYSSIKPDESKSNDPASITLNNGMTVQVNSPMLIHVEDSLENGVKTIVTGDANSTKGSNVWSNKLMELISIFNQMGE